MQNPTFVTLNNHRIKVQRWHRDSDAITFTTVIRGENLGKALVAEAQTEQVEITIDGEERLTGQVKILEHRASGAGPTAVHRIEFQFTPVQSAAAPKLTTDQKLDVILDELRAIRRELVSRRSPQSPQAQGGIAPPQAGATMLDFEIPIEDDDSGV